MLLFVPAHHKCHTEVNTHDNQTEQEIQQHIIMNLSGEIVLEISKLLECCWITALIIDETLNASEHIVLVCIIASQHSSAYGFIE